MIKHKYYSNGILVKESKSFTNNEYFRNPTKDRFFVMLDKFRDIQYINSTSYFKNWYTAGNNYSYIPITELGVTPTYIPEFIKVLGVGGSKGLKNNVVLFDVENFNHLSTICDYYNLSVPIDTDMINTLNNNPESIAAFKNEFGETVILGILIFNDQDIAEELIFVATYWLHKVGWETNFIVNTYSNGEIVAKAYEEDHRNITSYKMISDDYEVEYVRDDKDLLIKWKGIWKNKLTNAIEEEYFTSSKWWLSLVNYKYNDCFDDLFLCPLVNNWVAKSVRGSVVKAFFYVENSKMLIDIANYYSFNLPCDIETLNRLDTSPESFRVRHYDLFWKGPGNWVPLVLGSIVYKNNKPIGLELYERKRWNED